LSSRHWYAQQTTYDLADRPISTTTGADSPGVMVGTCTATTPANCESQVTTQYSLRGTVLNVGSSYRPLVSSVARDADGLVNQIVYGDVAGTTSAFSYDLRRRLSSVQTYRGAPPLWTQFPATYFPAPTPTASPPTSFQLLLEDVDYNYDVVDNPTAIDDWRTPSEWPAGAKPVSRKVQYDDLYRATNVAYSYSGGTDPWTDPFSAEAGGVAPDPRLAVPSPHVTFTNRAESQSFQYDWLGNTTSTGDDANGFYDRSLGTVTNGTATAGPYRLTGANGGTGTRGGTLSAVYDAAGNLSSMPVNRSGPCSPLAQSCNQRFAYDWDEVGRLVQARRWDQLLGAGTASSPLPTTTANVRLQYTYDSSDGRVLKTAIDLLGNKLFTAYIFGSLELRRAAISGTTDYTRSNATEVPYLSAHGVRLARVHYAEELIPAPINQSQHVLYEMPDHLGSTSIVVDGASGEVVERGSYLAYGQADSDYRPTRWGSFREDYRFTGKEEDVEVGLQYFGKRFYSPGLNRWVSADPLTVHAHGADLNAYAYVRGRTLSSSDPIGLDDPLYPFVAPYIRSLEQAGATAEKAYGSFVEHTLGDLVMSLIGGGHAHAPTDAAHAQNLSPETPYSHTAVSAAALASGGCAR
jgi:RHS repeat-associated protein